MSESYNGFAKIRSAPICAGIACTMVLFFVISCITASENSAYPRVAGIVNNAPERKWDLLTYVFFESNPILLVVELVPVVVFGPFVERSMGASGLLRYIFTVTVATGVCSLVCVLLASAVISSGVRRSVLCGGWVMDEIIMMGFAAAQSVTATINLATPANPATPIFPKIRAQQWPFLVWLCSLGVSVGGLVVSPVLPKQYTVTSPVLACTFGFWFAWAYLRFLGGQTVPSFAFHMFFFPAAVRNVVKDIGSRVYRVCGRGLDNDAIERAGASAAALARGSNSTAAAGGVGAAAERVLLPGSTPEEADRRRAVALAALASRIHEQREQGGAAAQFPPRPSQRPSAAAGTSAPVPEPDDDHKENAEV